MIYLTDNRTLMNINIDDILDYYKGGLFEQLDEPLLFYRGESYNTGLELVKDLKLKKGFEHNQYCTIADELCIICFTDEGGIELEEPLEYLKF